MDFIIASYISKTGFVEAVSVVFLYEIVLHPYGIVIADVDMAQRRSRHYLESIIGCSDDISPVLGVAYELDVVCALLTVISCVVDPLKVDLASHFSAVLNSWMPFLVVIIQNGVAVRIPCFGQGPVGYVAVGVAKDASLVNRIARMSLAIIAGDSIAVRDLPPIVARRIAMSDDAVVDIADPIEEPL